MVDEALARWGFMTRKLLAALALSALALNASAQSGAAPQPYQLAPRLLEPPLVRSSAGAAEADSRSAFSIIATDALYGAAAGALVGVGVALILNNDAWGRDILICTGIGILVGTAVGALEASNRGPDRIALDGLGSPDRDQPGKGVTTLARLGGRF
jgi:hypothetical protein